MKTLNVHEAKSKLSAVLAAVETDGESFLICRNGKPIADLTPHRKKDRLQQHPLLSRVEVHSDLLAPLAVDDWPEEAK